MSINVIVGGQYGSEAKGHVTDQVIQLAIQVDRDRFRSGQKPLEILNIRVGGPNAGHTVYDDNGNKFALRQVPVGAVHPQVTVAIGPGSELDLDVLLSELEMLDDAGHHPRVVIHSEVTMLTEKHRAEETVRHLHEKIGSTGKGIGAARADRIMRGAKTFRQQSTIGGVDTKQDTLFGYPILRLDPPEWNRMVNEVARDGHVVIEGVQGYGLGLHAGHYPQSTTADATAVDFLSMAGLSPWVTDEVGVIVVAREFPIRVAGNSGPMYQETTWEALGLTEEKTTVTQKVRRVGQWDADLVRNAVEANGGGQCEHVVVVLTMVDQRFPDLAGVASLATLHDDHPVWEHVRQVERDCGTTVVGFTTSPTTIVWR